jgi:hypothetical protein
MHTGATGDAPLRRHCLSTQWCAQRHQYLQWHYLPLCTLPASQDNILQWHYLPLCTLPPSQDNILQLASIAYQA